MVEFGLKLEDNKVAEWSDHYIAYDKLKAILSKGTRSVKRFDELFQKKPAVALQITKAYKTGVPTPYSSYPDLAILDYHSARAEQVVNSDDDVPPFYDDTTTTNAIVQSENAEYAKLLSPTSTYGSAVEKIPDGAELLDASGNIVSRVLVKASLGVSDYFQKNYERSVRDALKDIDQIAECFDQGLQENLASVNSFYNQKLELLEGHVAYLKESVHQIRHAPVGPQPPDIDDEDLAVTDNDETPILTHRKKNSNPIDVATAYFVSHLRKPSSAGDSQKLHHPPLAPLLADDDDVFVHIDANSEAKVREAESIQRAIVDSYRTAKLLHNFAILNYTGFVKIVKKYDKTFPSEFKGRYKKETEASNICNEGKAVEELAARMENLYANWFCDRNISEARAQMFTKKGDGLEMDWSQLRLGYRMGMCSILSLWVCWDCVWGLMKEGNSTIGSRVAFPVFRACGGLLMLQWCWGISVWVWTRYRVNYIYLFDLNPSIVDSPIVIFNDAVDNTLVYCVSTLLYYKAGAHAIPWSLPAGIFPFFMVVYAAYQVVFPLRTRAPMWKTIWCVATSPATSPTFFQGYVGDIFTSLVKVFQDLVWSMFFVLSGDWMISEDSKASMKHVWSRFPWYSNVLIPLVTLLPLWFRFNQCIRRYIDTGNRFPHLANAFKYALSQTVTLFGAFHPLYMHNKRETQVFQWFWTFAFVASSLYSFWWDLYMDWGLGQVKYNFLGSRLMYPQITMYYGIISLDFVLRFAWVLTLLPPQSGAKFALPAYLTLVSMMLEIFRRTIWGFLRLENEHRNNTAGFRRVDFVPLHFTTGHKHDYKQEDTHRGVSVLLEVAVVTFLVLGAAVGSVVIAQHATQSRPGEL